MRINKAISFFFFLFSVNLMLRAQPIERFNTFSYGVNEGLMQTTIADMEFDKNNFCWISFPNGIQKFDGNSFTSVPIQPGLPDDKAVLFFRSYDGDLFISHSRGITKYEIGGNRFIQIYKQAPARQRPVIFIGEDENVIYFYDESGTITGISSSTYKILTAIKTGFPGYSSETQNRPKFSANIINHKAALCIKSTLYLWDLQKREVVSQVTPISDRSFYLLRLKSEHEVLYSNYNYNNAIQSHNFITGTDESILVKGKDGRRIYCCNIYHWHNKILLSFNNQLFETDSTLEVLKSELVNFQNQPVAGNQAIADIREDNFGNLYLRTISGGIKKVIRNNYPVKYYGTGKQEENFTIGLLPDKKNNRVFIGTSENGLMIFDTLQHLVKHIGSLPGETGAFSVNSIIKDNNNNYILFVVGSKKIWKLSADLSALTATPFSTLQPAVEKRIEYFGNTLFRNEREAVVQTQQTIFRIGLNNNIASQYRFTNEYIMSGLWYNGKIITHGNNELIFLDGQTLKELKKVPFPNTGGVRCFDKAAGNTIYMGSNKGIFIIDTTGKILMHLKKENGLPDECIYAMSIDKEGLLWCSTNKGIFRLNKDNSVLQLKKEDGLQENEFNTNVVAQAEDGEVYFGGINGVSSFYPAAISSHEEKMHLLVTQIKVNNEEAFADTAAWAIERIELPYNQNSLSFDFIAMATNNPGQYIYQYMMEGIDKAWIQNDDLQTVRYFLPPGSYDLKLYASRFFNKDAKPMKTIRIIIHPPIWKAWWFLTVLAVLLLSAMAYGINQYNRNKYRKKLTELESEYKVQMERERISRDLHDSIGAYANAVLYNTELLEKEDEAKLRVELMKDVKFASKDIITALRETIWALKKDNYSAGDCLVRIRNFIQPFTRYYQHIQFKIEGEGPADKKLHYTKALNIVRIVQEAVTNSIKHATAKNIDITSRDRKGRWELTVTDDGKGFDYEIMKASEQGNGLSNMKKRAFDSGFDLTLESGRGKGTMIRLVIS